MFVSVKKDSSHWIYINKQVLLFLYFHPRCVKGVQIAQHCSIGHWAQLLAPATQRWQRKSVYTLLATGPLHNRWWPSLETLRINSFILCLGALLLGHYPWLVIYRHHLVRLTRRTGHIQSNNNIPFCKMFSFPCWRPLTWPRPRLDRPDNLMLLPFCQAPEGKSNTGWLQRSSQRSGSWRHLTLGHLFCYI